MKGILSIFISVVLCLSMLGCTKAPPATTGEQPGQSKEQAKEVSLNLFYWNQDFKPVVDKTIVAFQKENSNIKFESTIIPFAQYWTKLQTSLSTSSGADIFWLNNMYASEFIPKKLLLAVGKENIDIGNFPSSVIKPFIQEEKVYGVPFMYDSIAMIYNKELFDKAGVAYPTDKWTWNDLLEAAKKLTVKDSSGKIQQYGFVVEPSAQTCFYPFVYQSGANVYNDAGTKVEFNTPEGLEAFQFLYDLIYKYEVSPTPARLQEVNKEQMFASDKLAMFYTQTPKLEQAYKASGSKVDVAPAVMGKRRGTPVNTLSYAVSAKTKYPVETMAFMKFAATKQAAEFMSQITAPAYKDTYDIWLKNFPNVNAKAFVDAVETGFPMPVSAKDAGNSRKIFETEISNILMKQKDAAKGLSDAEKAMNETLK